MEGNFEDASLKFKEIRSDYIMNYNINFFKESKHKEITNLANFIHYLPYELNSKHSNFGLQTNEYIQASYFRENYSQIKKCIDSSFEQDTGKKLTVLIALFPNEVELSKRKLKIKLSNQKNLEKTEEIILTKPLSCLIFKSRKLAYEIEPHSFPFIILFYYIHGPIDKGNLNA